MRSKNQPPTPAKTWPELLREANTPKEILGLARDFIAAWTAEEIRDLPAGCDAPLRFQEPEDIVLYTFALSQFRLKSAESASLERMWGFFMEASQRLGAVMNRKARHPANT